MLAAPKAAFMRSWLSHIVRLRMADLTHRDLCHLLQLVKDSSLGRDLPKPWTQDAALRIVDRFSHHLFDTPMKQVSETMYWHDQPLHDLTYLGVGAIPPTTAGYIPPNTAGSPQVCSRASRLTEEDLFESSNEHKRAIANEASYPELIFKRSDHHKHSKGNGALDAFPELTERWAYRKVYEIVSDSRKIVLGSLKVWPAGQQS
jgi:hypothetical protein